MKVEVIETKAGAHDGLAMIDLSGAVWRTFSRPWWDIASWLWWWLTPGPKKYVQCRNEDGTKTRIRAVRVSTRHVRVGSPG